MLDFPQPENNPKSFTRSRKIPTGGIIKYETDAKTGFIIADRFQSMPVAYPANYGSLTQSLAGDGDPLDVVFYTPRTDGARDADCCGNRRPEDDRWWGKKDDKICCRSGEQNRSDL